MKESIGGGDIPDIRSIPRGFEAWQIAMHEKEVAAQKLAQRILERDLPPAVPFAEWYRTTRPYTPYGIEQEQKRTESEPAIVMDFLEAEVKELPLALTG